MSSDMFENLPPPPKPEPAAKPEPEQPQPPSDAAAEFPVVFGAPEAPVIAPPPFIPPPPPPITPPRQRAPKPEPTPKPIREKKQRGFVGRLARFIAIAVVAFAAFSVLWVLAYRVLPVPSTFLMVERMVQGYDVRRSPVSLTKISPHLVRAVIAAEDSKFCKHSGFDFDAMNLAFEQAERGKKLRGASTISQQTSKNVFLWQGRGFVRKGLEAYFTLLIETLWPKHRIMEAYLNSIEFGKGYFGAEAAARGYFKKPASKLTAREAAALAAVLPSPNKWRAVNPGRYVAKRIGIVQKRMSIVRRDGLDDCVYDRSAKKK